MADDKRSRLLGMNFMTARQRLDRDLLFAFATAAGHKCYRCGGELTRDSFSVEHKEHWAGASDPKSAYFDLSNIAYSHVHCNSKFNTRNRDHSYAKGCRCDECKAEKRSYRSEYSADKRRDRYEKYGT